ncbi:MAG: DNA ligase D [Bacillota bacterium]
MALQDYKRKRNFGRTPEPSPGEGTPAGRLRFFVQKHAASHLHYDFRLELDGVLKSWAVPKGPSLKPADKRLAVMVEDHPLDYGYFEGRIPKGNYGAGTVQVWDKGIYTEASTDKLLEAQRNLKKGLKKGHIKIVLYGEKLKGGFNLVRLQDGKNWLLIKEKDEYADLGKRKKNDPMPTGIKPMLARRLDKPFDRKGWIFEIKWDGYRALAEIYKGKVRLYSRNGIDLRHRFPQITKNLEELAIDAVLDGEIIAMKDGLPNFHALQDQASKAPIIYTIFDLLYLDGKDLRSLPLRERRARLQTLLPTDNIIISEAIEEAGKALFKAAKNKGLEGIIAKDVDSTYQEGVRSSSWLKIKAIETQEAVIIGYTAPRGGRRYLGALVLGSYDQGKLKYIGHSGGGFSEKELEHLITLLGKIRRQTSPVKEKVPTNSPITWVRPQYVCQVSFSEWTPDGRMRHPVYLGLRNDKPPKEVSKEVPGTKIKKLKPMKKINQYKISNPEKVYWPDEGYTKGDLLDYYDRIADYILPYLKDRPENLSRHPDGIKKAGFYHKDITFAPPDFVKTENIWSDHNEGKINYLLCQNKESLLYMANLGCIEINPWNSRIKNIDKPDYMVIDLDPGKKSFEDIITIAKETHKVLRLACEDSYIKTSGKSGLHIFVPTGGRYYYEQIKDLAYLIVRIVNRRLPALTSLERIPGKRNGKAYLDYLQNRRGQTIASAYSLRPVPGAPVSTPLEWKEVKTGLDPKKFNIETIFPRLAKKGDLWKPIVKGSLNLQQTLRCLDKNFSKEIGN